MSTPTIMKPAQRKRIFITGASGYVGSMITEFAIAEGNDVYGLSRSEKNDAHLTALGAIPIRGDLCSLDVLRTECADADAVIHLAHAQNGNFAMDYQEVLRIDFAAVDAMAESLRGTGKLLVVTSGSLTVEADPNGDETTEDSPLSKAPLNQRILAEQHALQLCEAGVKVCAVRLPPFVYGRGGSGIRLFMRRGIKDGEIVYVGDGSVRTSTIHVDDAARLYLLVTKLGESGDVFNAASATDVTMKQIAEAMGDILELPVKSYTFEEVTSRMSPFFARFLSAKNRASSAKAKKKLGWLPREEGIVEDIRYGSYRILAEKLRDSGAGA